MNEPDYIHDETANNRLYLTCISQHQLVEDHRERPDEPAVHPVSAEHHARITTTHLPGKAFNQEKLEC